MPSYREDNNHELSELIAKAGEAEAQYDHETAVACYSAALELPNLTLKERYKALNGRAKSFNSWGDRMHHLEDVTDLVALARQIGDKRLLAETMAWHGFHLRWLVSREFAVEAETLASDLGDERLQSLAKILLHSCRETENSWSLADEAVALARRSGDKDVLFNVLWSYGMSKSLYPLPEEGQRLAAEAGQLARESGDLVQQSFADLLFSVAETDLARSIDYSEKALGGFRILNNQYQSHMVANNLSGDMWSLGLYGRALAFANTATEGARRLADLDFVTLCLDNLGRAYLAKGLLDEAQQAFQEGLNCGYNKGIQAIHTLGLAQVALARGQLSQAEELNQSALALEPIGAPIAYAGLSAVALEKGNIEEALHYSSKAVTLLERGHVVTEYPMQLFWWNHYQVLRAMGDTEAFTALDKAKQQMLEPVDSLSDEGLRRNYLNKVPVNRDITLTWAAEAAQRRIALEPFVPHKPLAGNLRQQFRRVVDIGNRLTVQYDPAALVDFIIEEFVEMSGAKRVLLILFDEVGDWRLGASIHEEDAMVLSQPLIGPIKKDRQPLLRHDVGDVPPGRVAEIYQRSLVALPLVAQDRLLGLLYGDMRQIFGRFDDADLNLLSMLAHQAASALANAELVSTLEKRVEERTANLAQRNNELAIINNVQQALVAELDMDAIFEIVGEQLRAIYPHDEIDLGTYDAKNDTYIHRYSWELGKRLPVIEQPVDAFGRYLIQSRKAVLMRSAADFATYGPQTVEGTAGGKSAMFVPLIIGGQFYGTVQLFNIKREYAYDEADLRMLTTLANSMSVALENAKLFNEAKAARAEAERANESKSTFLANMSHELRTPLNAIIGFTRIVKRKARGILPDKQIDNLGKVQASAEHLLGLINTILDIAKIEAGRMDVANTHFRVKPLIDLCIMTTQPLLKPGVQMRAEIDPELPEIFSDQDKVKQILLNLLSNAAKFTHGGEIVVSGERRVTSSEFSVDSDQFSVNRNQLSEDGRGMTDDWLLITVRDTGIGMNEEQLGRIFEEFQQADATTTRQYGGTGLGLSISKQLANLLGGDLVAASQPGKGATFTLMLPLEIENTSTN
ncbi:MAG: ATP-binding protein [Candidatus Promineifilaceae bacterium]|nr:ATP-binding protein [Candidatus Promineifilaceae bacterium]